MNSLNNLITINLMSEEINEDQEVLLEKEVIPKGLCRNRTAIIIIALTIGF